MKNVVAIIPAKRNDNKLENKNILEFGDSNLLITKIRILKNVECIDEIVVSSEDDEILEMARNEGVISLKRDAEFSKKDVPFGSFVEYVCSQCEGKHILWASVTAPFITAEMYKEAISLYFEKIDEGYDSLISVQKYKKFILDENGTVNYKKGLLHKNSEDLHPLYIYTNGVVMAPREKMIEWKYNWGHIPFLYEIDKKAAIDINDRYDYELAKLLYERDINA